jgi:hypothetical protein
MGVYTKRAEPEVDARIRRDLQVILDSIQAGVADLQTVYLTGGFGRGEGTVVPSPEGWKPVNDYDLRIITAGRAAPKPDLGALGRELATRLRLPFVDIGWTPEDALPSLATTMENYDFRHGSQLIFGPDLRDRMPAFADGRLPWFEFARLLSNRAAGLLTAEQPSRKNDSDYGDTQMIKALIAVGDAVVALQGEYHHSYAERLSRFEGLASAGRAPDWLTPETADFVREAYLRKLSLSPRAQHLPKLPHAAAMLAAAFRDVVNASCGTNAKNLAASVRIALSHFGVRPRPSRRLYRLLHNRRWTDAFVEPGGLPRYVLLTQVPMLVAHVTSPVAAKNAYRRHYWWLPGARRRPHNGIGAVELWEQLVH